MKNVLFTMVVVFSMFCTRILNACELTFAWDPWAPYQMKVGDELTGFDIDMVKGIAKVTGCKFNFVEQNWTRIMEGIEKQTIDMAGAASITPERQKFANFSDEYRLEKMSLFIRKGEADKFPVTKISELAGKNVKVSVLKDYSYGEEFDNLAKSDEGKKIIDYATDTGLNVKKVANKRTDAFVEDELVGVYMAKQAGVFDKLEISTIPVSVGDVHFIFSKSVKEDVIAKINQGIKTFKETDEYKALVDKYTK